MDGLFFSTTVERTADKRLHVSWTKKSIPLKKSIFFNKAKHSEEWHQSIDASADILHPSDARFPYVFLHEHTDTYLKKKGKVSQTDIEARLTTLIGAHEARDIAIAAAAPFMTSGSPALKALLHVDLNVMQGSYWGLETWLQCLIAANHGNPASVTDLEALWARRLLPFAVHGATIAGRYLEGVSIVLRECPTPDIGSVSNFAILTRRAISDFAVQLEDMRLKCQWTAAYSAVAWMRELVGTSPAVTPPICLSPEHLLDSQFQAWRVWKNWRPHAERIARLDSMDSAKKAVVVDLVAHEGPDILTGKCCNLREGLVKQYGAEKNLVKYQGLVIEVHDRTRDGFHKMLERMAEALDMVMTRTTVDIVQDSMFKLFTALFIVRPVTIEALSLFEATSWVLYKAENDIYNAVREIYTERYEIGGRHFTALQHLFCGLDEPSAQSLREILLQPWLLRGIRDCIRECRVAVRLHVEQNLDWTPLALELHEFCITVRESKHELWLCENEYNLNLLPSAEQFKTVMAIYQEAQKELAQHPTISKNQVEKQDNQCISTSPIESVSAPLSPQGKLDTIQHSLEGVIEKYCIYSFEKSGELSDAEQRILDLMLKIWENTSGPRIDTARRSLALHISKSLCNAHILRFKCLSEIASPCELNPHDTFWEDALQIMRQAEKAPAQAIVAFTRLLTTKNASTYCWRDLLYKWLKADAHSEHPTRKDVLDYTLQTMKASEWLAFMYDLETLFVGLSFPIVDTDGNAMLHPTILQPQLLNWKTRITEYKDTIKRLEAQLGDDLGAVRYFLSGEESLWSKNLIRILKSLRQVDGKPVEVLMQKIVGKLSAEAKNGWEVADCVFNLLSAPDEVVEACSKLWDAKHGYLNIPGLPDECRSPSSSKRNIISKIASIRSGSSSHPAAFSQPYAPDSSDEIPTQKRDIPPSVVEVMFAGYIQNGTFDSNGMVLIQSIADLLNIEKYPFAIPEKKFKEAIKFWAEIEREIIEEAKRLEVLQKALKKKDPKGTAALLEQLGVPGNSVLDMELSALPAGVIDVVEKISHNEVEISFPLTAHTELQRSAMGIPKTAKTLLLRLSLDGNGEGSPSFCFHYDNDPQLSTGTHSLLSCSKNSQPPSLLVCDSVDTVYTWQLNRILHKKLVEESLAIVDLHSFVAKNMSELGHSCISCGISHEAQNAQLRRSTPCNLLACATLWYLLPLHVRIPEIRTDPFAVDLLLTTLYAAASSALQELLPGCPINSNEVVKSILNALPSLATMGDAVNLSPVLSTYHKDAERLISWACAHFRGFLVTATGLCKVPNLPPGTHQFVLANASPALESAFMTTLSNSGPKNNPKTTVLFHGTTPDRLPAILAQGLKVCSGTSLQRTGAAYGNGVYLAEEPATSFSYSPAAISWKNSGLHNMKMLLGCEVAGSGANVSPGIHVITNESAIMVRYVFMFGVGESPPIAGHMVPAMASGMRGLRMGTV